ncbi:glycosyltransferase family 2 protein [Natrinema hispanicum]|uniref:Glycosyl transferase family 2 n=1 Tax=Natrinema hispanicum TaxID=392421 RepID=A0A1G6TXP9_9EURY|nr:glycosyltransferase family 2 protein [Natrinema hispanicum]SDD33236.1 Glycosyl transferase family 2 [Natrinema hispanicum]SET93228.1 Glycosyl transferase family 2 [Natrinema hispanicum]
MSSTSPLVSVVIPTYNRSEVIGNAISSGLNQTFDDLEILVVDDGSTDQTKKVVSTFTDERVRYIPLAENQGANAARNTGVRQANGDLIAFLDADDEWQSDKIEKQVTRFDEVGADVGLVYTGITRKEIDGPIKDSSVHEFEGDVTRQLLLGNFIGTFSTIMVRKSVFDDVGYLNEPLPSWQDWEFYLRLSTEYNVAAVPEALTVRRSGAAEQISSNFQTKQQVSYQKLRPMFQELTENEGVLFQRRSFAALDRALGDAALVNGQTTQARQIFLRAIKQYPFDPLLYSYLLVSLTGTRGYRAALRVKRRIVG